MPVATELGRHGRISVGTRFAHGAVLESPVIRYIFERDLDLALSATLGLIYWRGWDCDEAKI